MGTGHQAKPVRAALGVAAAALTLAALASWAGTAQANPVAKAAAAADGVRSIQFRGEKVRVPAGWPVFRLDRRPRMCVRMDRRAVYLGSPGPAQRCPAAAKGRRRAILIDPGARARAAASRARASRSAPARISSISGFTGLGFDACTAPSRRAMDAWLRSSPYRAVGVYIGGVNRACSQPNLTAGWVSSQVAKGWSLIPTYVGLQAPTSSCRSCATLTANNAPSQGAADATDAVRQAGAIGMGRGSPIYNDMEGYTRTTSATNATLAYLAAWTNRLHALGYRSGVYSSSASGIRDLVSRIGTSYPLPDDIWTANWNGRQDTWDPYVPASAWANHQRIHQYRGGHNETWGGVTINIDNNYVDGATYGTSTAGSPDDPRGVLDAVESPHPGQVRVRGWAYDPNAPRQTVSIRVYVGGDRGQRRALSYELGPVAAQHRPDVVLRHRAAGDWRGFDTSFAVARSGRQRVCAWAVNIGRGADRRLGCRTIGIPVPLVLSRLGAGSHAVRVTVRCVWPAGTQCPGQMMLRTPVRVQRVTWRKGRRVVRTRVVRTRIAHRPFRLSGGRAHSFRIPLSARGRQLTRGHRQVRAQLVVAIPGGRALRAVTLDRGGGLPR